MVNIGSIIGDICGSVYEFNNVSSLSEVKLFDDGATFTDDTVMSCAVADWLVSDSEHTRDSLVMLMKSYGSMFPNAGYGGKFRAWLKSEDDSDYGSFGNGSGMRVGPVGFYAKDINECLELAEITAKTTHGHPEGIKGAKAIAAAIFLARQGVSKESIKKYITDNFEYDLDKKLTEIGSRVHGFDCTCQITVPEAIICFLSSSNFEDCIRKSIMIGGDTDTIACMAGGIAEAYYGVPAYLIEKAKARMDARLIQPLIGIDTYSSHHGIMPKLMIKRGPKKEA